MKKILWLKDRLDPELLMWVSGLLYLALIDPGSEGHLSLCIFRAVGFEYCPGCGLGKSISYLFHGDFSRSFGLHPLGSVAVIILAGRIGSLIRKHRSTGLHNRKSHAKGGEDGQHYADDA